MKKALAYFFLSLITLVSLTGCKKDEQPQDPFTSVTEFDLYYDYVVTVNSNNQIIHYSYTMQNDPTVGDFNTIYYGDSLAEKIDKVYFSPTDSFVAVSKFYLNNLGYADSLIRIRYENQNNI